MPNRINRRAYASRAQERKRQQDRLGLAVIAGCLMCFGLAGYGAYRADAARGISPSESLAMWGIGGQASSARPARLLGDCGGRILAAQEESDFPAGCAWIAPIKTESN